MAINLTTPVGRLVAGAVDKLQPSKDTAGKPKMGKDGVTPQMQCFFELAIPKGPEQHWNQTPWGLQIWQVGATSAPTMHQNPAFAWKITDGDSSIPNRKGKIPNQKPNYPGHWIIKFSSGFIPNRFRRGASGGFEQVLDEGAFKLGYFAQVSVKVAFNNSSESPGIYMNPDMVCFSGFGEEIYVGPDVDSAGFGAAPLPPGASAVPVGGAMPAPPALPGAPAPLIPAAMMAPPPVPVAVAAVLPAGLVQVLGAQYTIDQCRTSGWTDEQMIAQGIATRSAPMVAAPLPPVISAPAPAAPAAPIAPAGPVVPNPAFAQIPPPAAAGPQLTPAGAVLGTYEGFRAQGWDDAAMRTAGYLV